MYYLFQLRHPWERSFCALSTYTMFHWTVKMFLNLTLALTANIKLLFFAVRSNSVSLDKVHPEAGTIVKHSRTSLCRAWKRICTFLPSEIFHRRTNLFYGGRHVFEMLIHVVAKRLVITQPRSPVVLGRQYGGWKSFQHAKEKTDYREVLISR